MTSKLEDFIKDRVAYVAVCGSCGLGNETYHIETHYISTKTLFELQRLVQEELNERFPYEDIESQ